MRWSICRGKPPHRPQSEIFDSQKPASSRLRQPSAGLIPAVYILGAFGAYNLTRNVVAGKGRVHSVGQL